MKKTILLFVFTLLFISSCNTEQDNFNNSLNKTELIGKLNDFNNEYSSMLLTKRSWWQSTLDVISVVSADVLGAWAGAQGGAAIAAGAGLATGGTGAVVVEAVVTVGGAVSASWGSYCTVGGSACRTSGIDIDYTDRIEFTINDNKFKYIENVGMLHNKLIENVNLNAKETEVEWFVNNYTEHKTLIENILNSTEYNEIIQNVNNISDIYVQSGYDYNILIGEYKQKGYLDDTDVLIFAKFYDIYTKANDIEDVENITNFYKNAIINSNLEDNKKKLYLSSFSVASQSPLFWQNF